MTLQFYTYLHCKPNGDPFYVGKGCDTGSGRRSHAFGQRTKHHKNVVAKYGRDNIRVFVFPCESEAQAHADEIQQIAQLRREGYPLVNITSGGEGVVGMHHTPAARLKMSLSHRGVPLSESHRQNSALARVGKKLSEETKAKISAAHKGKQLSPETRAKIGSVQIGRKHTDEAKRKIGEAAKGNTYAKGLKLSAETLAKRIKGIKRSPETCARLSAAITAYYAKKRLQG